MCACAYVFMQYVCFFCAASFLFYAIIFFYNFIGFSLRVLMFYFSNFICFPSLISYLFCIFPISYVFFSQFHSFSYVIFFSYFIKCPVHTACYNMKLRLGCGMWDAGCRILWLGCGMLGCCGWDAGCWDAVAGMQDVGCGMQDVGCRMLGCWMLWLGWRMCYTYCICFYDFLLEL